MNFRCKVSTNSIEEFKRRVSSIILSSILNLHAEQFGASYSGDVASRFTVSIDEDAGSPSVVRSSCNVDVSIEMCYFGSEIDLSMSSVEL